MSYEVVRHVSNEVVRHIWHMSSNFVRHVSNDFVRHMSNMTQCQTFPFYLLVLPHAPILLLVWQRLRTLEALLCDAAHISCLQLSHFSLKSEFSSSCLSFECQKQIISCYIKLRRGKFPMSTEFLRDSIRKPSENIGKIFFREFLLST